MRKYKSQLHGKFLANVPEQYVFMCADGQIFSNLSDLFKGLKNMSDEVFSYHSNDKTHDFSNWIRDAIGDKDLAIDIASQTDRIEAAMVMKKRLDYLRSTRVHLLERESYG